MTTTTPASTTTTISKNPPHPTAPRTLADAINALAAFCGPRDIPVPTRDALRKAATSGVIAGKPVDGRIRDGRVDAMVLFGGSIIAGVDVLAEAMRGDVARRYVIVGGAGHTTGTLRDVARRVFPDLTIADDEPEACIFDAALATCHGLHADWLETESTNCGNNITYLLDLLREHMPDCRSVVLAQDATMQRRMTAGLEKFAPDMLALNYATYHVRVVAPSDHPDASGTTDHPNANTATAIPLSNGNVMAAPSPDAASPLDLLDYDDALGTPEGMWPIDRYVSLLMGDTARLTDDGHGYGPNGKNYIAHVDVPDEVRAAAAYVRDVLGDVTRAANPAFASIR
ncbi:hypothetical protein JS528_09055 [Bifidobacterium sp. MA2]|uniref:DUF218 domain-containing protein n=1 Tax=Bifidobacterium santillanense TaxID=2809028 RepID=A0ABS5UR90_9BIFI|nr:hypothetical protein [Bifidobacterium santillanense]MBT1173484.1 hypothetical protein [Bifidobacterium santillanense]